MIIVAFCCVFSVVVVVFTCVFKVFPADISFNITMIDSGSRSDRITGILRTQRSAVLRLLQAVLSIYSACMSRYESHETHKSTVRSWIYDDRQKRPSALLWLRFGAGPDPVASGRSSDTSEVFPPCFGGIEC